MLSTNKIKQAVQEDIHTLGVNHFSYGGIKKYDQKFNDIIKKIIFMTWLPSMLPLVIFQVTHRDDAKDAIVSAGLSVLRTFLGFGIFNALFSLVFVVALFKSIDTYLTFKFKIRSTLMLGLNVDNLVKRTAIFMCGLFLIFSLGVAFTFDLVTISWAWPMAFFPSLVLARIFYAVEKRRLGLTALIRKIKRRIHDEEKRTWLKLWPNVM